MTRSNGEGALHQILKRKERSGASATGEKLPPTSSTYGRAELRHRRIFESGTGMEREQQQGLFTKKIPGVFDSARGMLPVAHHDPHKLLSIYTHDM